jgi:hypothetical protein
MCLCKTTSNKLIIGLYSIYDFSSLVELINSFAIFYYFTEKGSNLISYFYSLYYEKSLMLYLAFKVSFNFIDVLFYLILFFVELELRRLLYFPYF